MPRACAASRSPPRSACCCSRPASWSVQTLGHATSGTFPAGGPERRVRAMGGRGGGRRRRRRRRRAPGGRRPAAAARRRRAGPAGGGGMFGGDATARPRRSPTPRPTAAARSPCPSQRGASAPIIQSGADVAALGGFSGRESEVSVELAGRRGARRRRSAGSSPTARAAACRRRPHRQPERDDRGRGVVHRRSSVDGLYDCRARPRRWRRPGSPPAARVRCRPCAAPCSCCCWGSSAGLVAAPGAHAGVEWLCRPGLAHDPCTVPADTARYAPDGRFLGRDDPRAARRRIDCFYVYPTVSGQPTPAATRRVDPELRDRPLPGRPLLAHVPGLRAALPAGTLAGLETAGAAGRRAGATPTSRPPGGRTCAASTTAAASSSSATRRGRTTSAS